MTVFWQFIDLKMVFSALHDGGGGSAKDLPLVKVVATGGTIANTPSGRLHAREVAEAIPELKKIARLDVEEIVRLGSHSITIKNWLILARRINEILKKEREVKGVVVTHGSNTLEETAYFLNLTVKSERPVVLTAAQRRFTTMSSDSPKNFLQAVRVAANEEAKGKGALVVTNDLINAAREVTKTISSRLETYSSKDIGVLGYVDNDQITFYRAPLKKHTTESPFDVSNFKSLPRVDIVYTYVDADEVLIESAVEKGKAEGLVIAGFSSGSPTPAMDAALKRIVANGFPVVLSQRGGMGRVRINRNRSHLISADNLTPQKARILLMLALTKTKDIRELQRIFQEY
ncbi:MAG: asparaginase [Deltaproteobacteria bacterium]|nr:asparaginase [Deltaproteobacteria bacterium]